MLLLPRLHVQGSTWVFTTYFQPFLVKNQADIDANIAAVQSNSLAFLQSRLQVFWQTFWDLATKASANGQAPAPGAPPAAAPGAGPVPGANYADMARSLWTSYGASLMGAAQQAMRPATGAQPGAASASASASAAARPGPSPYDLNGGSSSSVQVNKNAFSSEMVSNFSPAASSANVAPPFPQPEHQ